MWLSLTEYSLKHHVSISTLRRKIKADDIQYKLNDGKYYLFDESQQHRPSQSSETSSEASNNSNSIIQKSSIIKTEVSKPEGESVITAANRLLADLKKAYTQVLHEKEEQIIYLKEEISDLKTLVKILESHNQRNESRLSAQDSQRNYSSDVYQIDSDI